MIPDVFLGTFVRAEVAHLGKLTQANQKTFESFSVLLLALAKVALFYGLIDLTFDIHSVE